MIFGATTWKRDLFFLSTAMNVENFMPRGETTTGNKGFITGPYFVKAWEQSAPIDVLPALISIGRR